MTTTDWLIFAALCLIAVVLCAALFGPRVLCRLLGHQVGLARTGRDPLAAERAEPLRVSRCVRCQRPFTD